MRSFQSSRGSLAFDLGHFGTETGLGIIAEVVAALIVVLAGFLYRRVLIGWIATASQTVGAGCRLFWSLSTIRMVVFNRDRSDYGKGFIRGPRRSTIPSYLATARAELVIVSVSFITGAQFEKVEQVLRDLLVDRKVKVTVSLIAPIKHELLESVARTQGLTTSQLEQQIIYSSSSLLKLRRALPKDAKDRLVLRNHHTLPFASAIIIDPDTKHGTIQVETKAYATKISESFGFTLRAGGSHPLYRTLVGSYRQLVADAVPMRDPARNQSARRAATPVLPT